MARSSPGVRRMAAVLDFMADHPGQAFALTDLVRALRLSRATCHALLTGLVEVGYLYRTSEKTYVLGPALATIGRVAAEHFSPLQIAKPEMRRLADQFDVVCAAMFLEGDNIVSRERAASASHVGYSLPLGTRIRLRPRSMPVFLASAPAEARAFLDSVSATPAQRETAEAVMAFVRAHGFSVLVRTIGEDAEPDAPIVHAEDGDFPVVTLDRIAPGETYALSSLTAPVFDARGRVEFVLGLMGFHGSRSGEEILAIGGQLRQACDRIGDFLAGKATPA
ncbi:MAG: helix-turn-helix domain-containing protein [Sphingomonadales bacterium]|nr:helix-turn-helix domain-containing protein [Sphingomonadales bacterium]